MLGVLGPGDGYLFEYGMGLNAIDKDFVDYFQYCLEKTFGLKCKRYNRIVPPSKLVKVSSKQDIVILCSKSAVSSIKNYKASFKEMIWNIPKKIKNSTKGYKASYLGGVFDSQASLGNKQIIMGIKNKKGLEEIRVLLRDIEIRSGVTNNGYRIFISGERHLKLYDKLIGFKIKRKNDKLKKILGSYKISQPDREDIKRLLPTMTKLRKDGLSYRKIALATGIGKGAVTSNLRRTEICVQE